MTGHEELPADDLDAVTHILDTTSYYEQPAAIIAAGFHRLAEEPDAAFMEKLEGSSFGTAAAQALRTSVDAGIASHIVERAKAHDVVLTLSDSLKMLRETLSAVQNGAMGARRGEHSERIGRIIAEIDRQRPLGSNGKHGDLHTATCGCLERPEQSDGQAMSFIIEIDWAEDRAGNAINGPVGPFPDENAADRWATDAIYNGEWNTARLHPRTPVIIPGTEAAKR